MPRCAWRCTIDGVAQPLGFCGIGALAADRRAARADDLPDLGHRQQADVLRVFPRRDPRAILTRLRRLEASQVEQGDWLAELIESEGLDAEDLIEESGEEEGEECAAQPMSQIDRERLRAEIVELEQYLLVARGVREDQKSFALLKALETWFGRMSSIGAARKAVIFNESVRTQDYLARFLEAPGHGGRVVKFSGRANDPGAQGIYHRWLEAHDGTDRVNGKPCDRSPYCGHRPFP